MPQTLLSFFRRSRMPAYEDYLGRQIYFLTHYPDMRKLRIGERDKDVICRHDIDDPRFNTNIENYIGELDEMNWGYVGTGPWLLALNILYTFTEGDRRFSLHYVWDFRRDFLVRGKDRSSFTIPAQDICAWIYHRQIHGDKKYVQHYCF